MNKDSSLVVSKISLIVTIIILVATVVTLFASVQIQTDANTNKIEQMECEQKGVIKMLYEISLNLKNLMHEQGYEYQEVK